jgi:phenylpropionate dioxygenase-like ring-hydroxylating dioxygenase large terminal subunit
VNRHDNHQTQPARTQRVFNNWSVVAKAWYPVCRSADLPAGAVRGVDVARQHLVVFRGADGRVRALDGYCPHMGTDLAIGTVDGPHLRCFFHHWAFDGGGACVHIPTGDPIPQRACTRAWDSRDAYGLIWVFPEATATFELPTFPDLPDAELRVRVGAPYERACHHHVCMINGIDVQHLSTVHGIAMDLQVTIDEVEAEARVDITLDGRPPTATLTQRLTSRLMGGRYSYHMRYSGGSVGLLTTLRDVALLGRLSVPRTRMLFAYQPTRDGRTRVWPVFLTERRRGLLGRLLDEALLALMYAGFWVLRDADGRVYDNIRFQPNALLAQDAPVARFFTYTNRLQPSEWAPVAPEAPVER